MPLALVSLLLILLLHRSQLAHGSRHAVAAFPKPRGLLDRRSSASSSSPRAPRTPIPSEPFPALSGTATDRTTGERTTNAQTQSANALRLGRAVSNSARAHAAAQNPRLTPARAAAAAVAAHPPDRPSVDLGAFLRMQRLRAPAAPPRGASADTASSRFHQWLEGEPGPEASPRRPADPIAPEDAAEIAHQAAWRHPPPERTSSAAHSPKAAGRGGGTDMAADGTERGKQCVRRSAPFRGQIEVGEG